ncbi:MAG: hypothetical protein ACP5HU_11040 [Phycisphaerae bacterium]
MRAILAAVLTGALLAGCGLRTRPAMMEFSDDQGQWLVEIHGAKIERDGWSLAVTEAKVNDVSEVPKLDKLTMEIWNTSDSRPLVLAPKEIYLHGLRGSMVELGPYETVVLSAGESAAMEYAPGVRAPVTGYPFVINVTVFGNEDLTDPRTVEITLY